jgi:NadR type nicotinamide-nucleotide adenylyltransferase
MQLLKKVVIIGPESTGKSTLCKQLAQDYETLWVPEFAREYLEKSGTDYSYEDLLSIAKGQIELEEKITREIQNQKSEIENIIQPSLLFIDTDMYVMKVWCEYAFNKCHNWILNQIAMRKYDLYLLCNIDLPWIKDNLREYPDFDTRAKLYSYYKDTMINQAVTWIDISGDYQQRFEEAIYAIDSILL